MILLAGGAIVLLALLHGALFWPGIMTWDAIRQYGQAVSGQYDDWHPPAMNWLWRGSGLSGPDRRRCSCCNWRSIGAGPPCGYGRHGHAGSVSRRE